LQKTPYFFFFFIFQFLFNISRFSRI
jgi:hypothetical protein